MRPVDCLHMNHINAVVSDFDESVQHFRKVYGCQFSLDLPSPDWHACLITIGNVIFELFAPYEAAADYTLFSRSPGFIGLEYQVRDVDEARAVVESREMRIVRDLGHTIHTHPADGFGVSFEFFNESFHDEGWITYLEPLKPLTYWRDVHPLGCTGLKRIAIAVEDAASAGSFLQQFAGARKAYATPRARAAASAEGFAIGDVFVELLTPTEDGPISRFLERQGPGIRSIVFAVRDIPQARR